MELTNQKYFMDLDMEQLPKETVDGALAQLLAEGAIVRHVEDEFYAVRKVREHLVPGTEDRVITEAVFFKGSIIGDSADMQPVETYVIESSVDDASLDRCIYTDMEHKGFRDATDEDVHGAVSAFRFMTMEERTNLVGMEAGISSYEDTSIFGDFQLADEMTRFKGGKRRLRNEYKNVVRSALREGTFFYKKKGLDIILSKISESSQQERRKGVLTEFAVIYVTDGIRMGCKKIMVSSRASDLDADRCYYSDPEFEEFDTFTFFDISRLQTARTKISRTGRTNMLTFGMDGHIQGFPF